MVSNKKTSKKARSTSKAKRVSSSRRNVVVISDGSPLMLGGSSNGEGRKQPYRINPETDEEREKRLAARKALTLEAARIAYENHHRRKAS